jgi:hypothetical protein
MDIKHFINQATLPSDDVFPPQLEAFLQGATRHDSQVRLKRFLDLGLQQRSDVELRLGEYVGPSLIFSRLLLEMQTQRNHFCASCATRRSGSRE